jgi:hypothetical protein
MAAGFVLFLVTLAVNFLLTRLLIDGEEGLMSTLCLSVEKPQQTLAAYI